MDSAAKMKIGQQIRKARDSRGLGQKELASALGWDADSGQARISNYERGKYEASYDVLLSIANALDYPALYFLAPLADFPVEFVESLLRLPPNALRAVEDLVTALHQGRKPEQ